MFPVGCLLTAHSSPLIAVPHNRVALDASGLRLRSHRNRRQREMSILFAHDGLISKRA